MAVLECVELLTLFCCLDARSCRGQVHVLVLEEVRDRERGCWPYTMEKGVNPVVDEHDEGRTVYCCFMGTCCDGGPFLLKVLRSW